MLTGVEHFSAWFTELENRIPDRRVTPGLVSWDRVMESINLKYTLLEIADYAPTST